MVHQPFYALMLVIEAGLGLVSLACLVLVFNQPRNKHLRLVALLGLLPIIAMSLLYPALWGFYEPPPLVAELLWRSRTLSPTTALALSIIIHSEATNSVRVSPFWYALLIASSGLVFLPSRYATSGFIQLAIHAILVASLLTSRLDRSRLALYGSALVSLVAAAVYVVLDQLPWEFSFLFSMVPSVVGLTHYRLYEIMQLIALSLLLRHFINKGGRAGTGQQPDEEGPAPDEHPKAQ